jgi:hypothetical protein
MLARRFQGQLQLLALTKYGYRLLRWNKKRSPSLKVSFRGMINRELILNPAFNFDYSWLVLTHR